MIHSDEALADEEGAPQLLHETRRDYKFAILMLVFFFCGLILVLFGEEHVGVVFRDIGIALLIAGTVGLGVEFVARKEADKVLLYIARRSIEEHAWPKLREIGEAVDGLGTRSSQGMEQVLSVSRNLEAKIQEVGFLLVSNNLRAYGVTQMYSTRTPDLVSYINQAPRGSTIRLLAISLNRLASDAAETVIRRKLEEGCAIEALVIDPESRYVRIRALEEFEKRPATEAEVGSFVEAFVEKVRHRDYLLRNMLYDLPDHLRSRIEIRRYDAPTSYFLMDNNRTVLVGFYLRGLRGEECPHIELEVREGGAYHPFRRHFDAWWDAPYLVDRRREAVPVDIERRRLQTA